jgi:hypothetical protein
MPLNRISPKRKATTTLGHNSTFAVSKVKKEKRVYSIAEMKASGLLKRASKLGDSKSERAKWKAKADKYFSEFIRLRDAGPDGMVTCITNPKVRKHWREVDCGHWISRAKESTRYDERNANGQSKQANRFQGGHFLEHGLAIDRKFGPGTREALEKKAGQLCKRTVSDYRFIAETYKSRVQWIKEHYPDKYATRKAA